MWFINKGEYPFFFGIHRNYKVHNSLQFTSLPTQFGRTMSFMTSYPDDIITRGAMHRFDWSRDEEGVSRDQKILRKQEISFWYNFVTFWDNFRSFWYNLGSSFYNVGRNDDFRKIFKNSVRWLYEKFLLNEWNECKEILISFLPDVMRVSDLLYTGLL